ncbi:motile sperm domain-containing 2 [Paramuricea clavata]|uniref:Motile sperm domain-containing 2 n=1 Tax=Paramuricea clavata TaxID=317549 RepID=A0A6S7JDX5_PARCT|nr:motile sperm domain-containing 2 [Paramuricea clavata]
MASGVESRPYMDKVSELRKKFLDKHYASDKNYYDSRDISRVKSDDLFVQQFLVGRDGNVDKAQKLMMEALKWRKEFGINGIKTLNLCFQA